MHARRAFPPAPSDARALLIQGHPRLDSFNHALGAAWAAGAEAAGVPVDVLELATLDFDPLLVDGRETPLEPDLLQAQQRIARAGHLTLASPVWWGSSPALLKGFLDRTLQAGWAYGSDDKGNPVGGLSGRSGRVLLTMDAPGWWDRFAYGRSALRQLRDATLWFCDVKPARATRFLSIGNASTAQRERMLAQARAVGTADARALLRRLPPARPALVDPVAAR